MKKVALLSVFNKTGIVAFAQELTTLGFEILASGGTAKVLTEAGLAVVDMASIVGEPLLGHRVVTLSFELHAGLLAQDNEVDNAELNRLGIRRIDLVYVNMYPLMEETIREGATLQSVIKKTDIGGPTMLRSAAKGRRIVMCKPEQIPLVLGKIEERNFMRGGRMLESFISRLVAEVETEVAAYCSVSAAYHTRAARDLEFVEDGG